MAHRNSWFTYLKWWCSIVFCTFTKGIQRVYFTKIFISRDDFPNPMENPPIFNGKIHYFDWAMFNSYVSLPGRVLRLMEYKKKLSAGRTSDSTRRTAACKVRSATSPAAPPEHPTAGGTTKWRKSHRKSHGKMKKSLGKSRFFNHQTWCSSDF